MPNHARLVLELVATSGAPQEAPMRQAAAVRFKNVVLKGWKIPTVDDEDKTEGIRISAEERDIIKKHLVQLMCTTPPQIQTLLSASIAIIAETDYFDEWTDLLPSLVQQFAHTDISVVIGVLKTADTIFLSFRNAMRSDPLYAKIKYTLAIVAAPLTALLAQVGQSVADPQIINDKSRLVPCVEALTLICSIFYSLNWQDLPEYFEDNMRPWMEAFALYLQAGILQILEDPGEEDQASPMDDLQTQIIQNLGHYADKDEDDFVKDYLPNFTSLVWGRLITLTDKPKHDGLTNMSIRFLTSLVQKPMHTNLFRSEGVLQQMVEKIVIPNLTFREADQVKFEEDPHEYMVTEVEGSDSESRRRCAQDLLRAMCRQLEESTTTICKGHAHTLLTEYKTNPNDKWASKDAAVRSLVVTPRQSALSSVLSRVHVYLTFVLLVACPRTRFTS
jgi:exportin-2 (importin alpha re-exporter)